MRKWNIIKTLIICFVVIIALTASGCGRGDSGSYSGSYAYGNISEDESKSSNSENTSNGEFGSGNTGGGTDTTYIGSISLVWDPPVDNVDGSPLTNLAGYKIYYGTSFDNYKQSIDVGTATHTTIENLSSGYWCFAATSYNTAGNESDYSNQFCAYI